MHALENPLEPERPQRSFATAADIEEFVSTLQRYERGELSADQWRSFRLVRGTYGQRQSGDAQMLRVKIPQGILDAGQLRALADVSESYSRGFGHVTTRQNVQFHFVKLQDAAPAMTRLAEAGLTTREACGNSVRNVTGCPYAGVAADEVFDVTPYAEALTRHLLRHPLASSLPRKFKVAFEGCAEDHALTAINDLGFQARVHVNGSAQKGFRVTAGGGTAILCASGGLLFDFLPADEILNVAEALLRVFHRLGDYKHRQRNRMKFLIRAMGWDAWRSEFDKALADVRERRGPQPSFRSRQPSGGGGAVAGAADSALGRRSLAARAGVVGPWPRDRPRRSSGPERPRRRIRRVGPDQRAAPEASGLRNGRRHAPPRGHHRRAVPGSGRPRPRLRRRDRSDDSRAELRPALGAVGSRFASSTGGSPRPASASPGREPRSTS